MHLGGPGHTDWEGVIAWRYGTGPEATGRVFECLDSFLDEVKRLGVEAIIAGHADYERQRYGFLSSSRLARRGEA